MYFADENLFDVFTIVLKGDPKTALKDPFSVMLSEETARKYFGNEDPMNKVLRSNNQFDIKVTGVYKGFPANSHMHPGMLVSFNTLNDSTVYGAENCEPTGEIIPSLLIFYRPILKPKKMMHGFPLL